MDLKTFVGSQRRSVKETEMQVYLDQGEGQMIEMLVTDLDLDFKVHGLREAIKNLAQEGSRFADSNFNTALYSDNVSGVECLLGTDALQFFKQFSFSERLRGTVINTSFGIIPFGDIENFLTHDQRRGLESRLTFPSAEVTENLAHRQGKAKPKSAWLGSRELTAVVNSVLEPNPSYFNLLSFNKTESEVELGLEKLFRLERIGIKESNHSGSLAELMIQRLEKSIKFSHRKYQVELPWYRDVLDQVLPNFKIALATLDKVYRNLNLQGLGEAYGNVFKQELENNIIECIHVDPSDYDKFIWIPHGPIIKQIEQITTKIIPVFNFSLKVGNLPSLNEASYPGVDLMGSLYKQLCGFRHDKYVILADIKQAFLQIYLKLEEDRNRFCSVQLSSS